MAVAFRIALLALVAVAAAAGNPQAGEAPGPTPPRPNVVVYLIDTLRADRMGVYGYQKPTTPLVDALAAQSVVFEQAYAPSPWTLPSIVSLMASRPICEHGVVDDGDQLSTELSPLAERVERMGYATASFYANPFAGRASGMHRGFGVHRKQDKTALEPIEAWIAEKRDRPFFLYVHDVQPHNPFEARPDYLQPFGEVAPQTRAEIRKRMFAYRGLTRADYEARKPIGSTDNTAEQRRALDDLNQLQASYQIAYDAVVREADTRVGRLVRFLRQRGELNRTLFIVIADHGEEMNDHGGWLHDQSVYEELVRAPLLIRFPGAEHGGTRVKDVVTLLDVMPTVLDVLGQPVSDDDARGRSLVPLVRGERRSSPDEPAVTALRINRKKYYRPWKESRGDVNVVVREGPWKAIWNVEPGTVELYDLSADPRETTDRSGEQTDRARRLRAYAERWYEECGKRAKRPSGGGRDSLDSDTVERLRSLGYLN